MKPVHIYRGSSPVILAIPHTGTFVPAEIKASLNETGRRLADTDWHVDRLYRGLLPGATIVRANFHRYVIDANRDPSGKSLYPGQNTTGLCPLTDFDGVEIYKQSRKPDANEIARRQSHYHTPYHQAMESEIKRLRQIHKNVVLYDCHSIRSHVPFLFEGTLPDFNIGTNGGTTCDPYLEKAVVNICNNAKGYTSVLNGRFKGGWTTRHYGNPDAGVHAIQMELSQKTYMDETPPWTYQPNRARNVRRVLRDALQSIAHFR
ncbi:MAG: N-formylglutamate deformylase [Robiginitomaculum sp.]|nr:N-formylglutamate deformylase [Robiginitomaculum sp.]